MLEFVRSEADVPKGHERVGSMNVGLRGSTTPKKPGQGGSASGSGIPNNGTGTSSGVPTLQGAAGIDPGGRTPRQMTYVIGSQSQVPRSPTKSLPSGRGIPGSGEGGYHDTPGKRLSPLIYSDDEAARQSELEGMGSGRGPPGPTGGAGEPSSSARMRNDFERQPSSEPLIFSDGDTFFDGLTGLMVISQGENSGFSEGLPCRVNMKNTLALFLRVSAGSRYQVRTSQLRALRPPWRRIVVHLEFIVSPASALSSPALAVCLLFLVGMVSAILSELSTLRMRSWRTQVFENGGVADAVRLGLSILVQRGKDRRLRNLLAPWLAAMPLMLVSIQ
jgi:hypothetical protein